MYASTNTPPVLGLSSVADIDGEAADDQSGYFRLDERSGDRVAIGAYFNDGTATDAGHVRIYNGSSGSWSNSVVISMAKQRMTDLVIPSQ